MTPDLDQAALQAQLESLAVRWQRDAHEHHKLSAISDQAVYSDGYGDALDRCAQALKGLLDQWQ